ncbi:hypothetical protein ACN265_19315 [Micromonospora sp. WMMD730]|uniref:hypothetical protein n=1 Tax=Micromonospora sp. WMMD730 TaxID=3404128 RepID=UPI003B939C1F
MNDLDVGHRDGTDEAGLLRRPVVEHELIRTAELARGLTQGIPGSSAQASPADEQDSVCGGGRYHDRSAPPSARSLASCVNTNNLSGCRSLVGLP